MPASSLLSLSKFCKFFSKYLAAVLFFSLALMALCFQFLDYQRLKAYLDPLTSKGQASFFTPEFFQSVRLKLIFFAGFCLMSTGLCACFATSINRSLLYFFHDFLAVFKEWHSDFKKWLRNEDPKVKGLLLSLVFAGSALRALYMDFPMRCDESFSFIHYASRPFYIALSNYSYLNNHIFHSLLMRLSYLVFGDLPEALRLPAFLAGCAFLPLTYWFSRKMQLAKEESLIAVALVAASSIFVEYSANGRGYTMFWFFTIAAIGLLVEVLERPRAGNWVWFILIQALGFYTLPMMQYPSAMIWLTLCILKPRWFRKIAFGFAAMIALTAFFYLPVLLTVGKSLIAKDNVLLPKSLTDLLFGMKVSFTHLWDISFRDLPPVEAFLLAALAVLGVARIFQKRIRVWMWLFLTAISTSLLIMLVQRTVPHERSWLYFWPLFSCFIALGFGLLLKNARTAMLVLSSVIFVFNAVSVIFVNSILKNNELRDAEAVLNYIKPQLDAKTAVAVGSPLFEPMEYYAYRAKLDRKIFFPNPLTHKRVLALSSISISRKPPAMALKEMGLQDAFPGPYQELKKFDTATVYVSTEKAGGL